MPYIFSILFFTTIFFFHWLVYRFFISLFKIEKKQALIGLRAVFAFLSVSFFGASILAHFWDNFFTRGLYAVSGFWYGFFINLLLAMALAGLAAFCLRFQKPSKQSTYLACAAFASALVFSALGVLNVLYPGVKEIDVWIKDLPSAWQDKTIVQLSDVHLGKALGVNFLNRVANKTNRLNADLILITGDLFDGMDGNLGRFTAPLDNLRAKEGVYYIDGNHEIYAGLDEAYAVINSTGIKPLKDDVVDIGGLQLIGISYPDLNKPGNIYKIISENAVFDKSKPSILLFHSPTNIGVSDNFGVKQSYFYPDIDFQIAQDLGVDLQLSGHTHNGQLFPFNFLTHLIYKGYDNGLHKLGDFQIYIADGVGAWGPTMRTTGRAEIVKIRLREYNGS